MDIEKEIESFSASLCDFAAPAVGWKILRLYVSPLSFASPYYSSCKWPVNAPNRVVKASCGYSGVKDITRHEPPAPEGVHPSHSCGIYACYFPENLTGNDRPRLLFKHTGYCYGAMVLTVLEGWGTVEAHESDEDGFRAEYARIAALCRPTEAIGEKGKKGLEMINGVLEEITGALDVPLLDRDEAEPYAQQIGVNLAPSKR